MSAYMCDLKTLRTVADFIYHSDHAKEWSEVYSNAPQFEVKRYQSILELLTNTNITSLKARYDDAEETWGEEWRETFDAIEGLGQNDVPLVPPPVLNFLEAEREWAYQSCEMKNHQDYPAFYMMGWVKNDLLKSLAQKVEDLLCEKSNITDRDDMSLVAIGKEAKEASKALISESVSPRGEKGEIVP